ncbi:unnamed protein product [marine sediment metagenome]|uniref:YkgJ family cysteine cluster protein n=1 Tax=marine sediment metagenome TaxID=412755 RepID=X0XA14_9ZZZZ
MTGKLADELARLYRELDAEIARLGWGCRACGECCCFQEHGHELLCSEVEAEYLVTGAQLPEVITDEVCPFLDDRRCTRRQRRTLACRTYFCDAAAEEKMTALTELWTDRLKRLHEHFDIGWKYARLSEHLNRRKTVREKG